MITQEKILWSFIKIYFSELNFFKEMYGDQFGEFVCEYWGLKNGKRKNQGW